MTGELAAGCLTLAQGKHAFLAGLLLGAAVILLLAGLGVTLARYRHGRS
jgi:hypothetical protein